MTTRVELDVGGMRRVALVDAPEGLHGPTPVVIMFHGAGATAELARTNTGWGDLAARERIIAVFPEGSVRDESLPQSFRTNPQSWNDGSGRGHVARRNIDDVGFVAALMEEVAARWPVDPRRVYATGFSNGASLVFRLATELSGRLAAVAPVAGHLWLEDPRPTRAVSLLLITGAADPLNPLEGGTVTTPWGRPEYHPPVVESARRWAGTIGCSAQPSAVTERPGVETLRWEGCDGAAEVRYMVIDGLGHAWPGARRLLPEWIGGPSSDLVDGAAAVWRFLAGHHL